ncbi:MAG: hypothetical protein GXN93_01100 [Candidatus Diapherotrites archaeon]|nr:hypothetical protein [Candidatus Diapherotrites archaeon]
MPPVIVRGRTAKLICAKTKKPIDVRVCYSCPYYMFRNNNVLVCRLELSMLFGNNSEVVMKDPVVVKDSNGNYWAYTKNHEGRYGWYAYDIAEKKILSEKPI